MSRDKLRDPTRFGTMVMDPPPRKHSGTMVLEAPRAEPPRTPTPPPAPTFGARPCEPTCVLGEDYGHLAGLMTDEATAAADVGARVEPLPFRSLERPSEPPRSFAPVAPPRPSPPPPPPAYMGSIMSSERAVRAAPPEPSRDARTSVYRSEPAATERVEAPRASAPPPPRNDARASSEKRLSSLLHGPWLFSDDDD